MFTHWLLLQGLVNTDRGWSLLHSLLRISSSCSMKGWRWWSSSTEPPSTSTCSFSCSTRSSMGNREREERGNRHWYKPQNPLQGVAESPDFHHPGFPTHSLLHFSHVPMQVYVHYFILCGSPFVLYFLMEHSIMQLECLLEFFLTVLVTVCNCS